MAFTQCLARRTCDGQEGKQKCLQTEWKCPQHRRLITSRNDVTVRLSSLSQTSVVRGLCPRQRLGSHMCPASRIGSDNLWGKTSRCGFYCSGPFGMFHWDVQSHQVTWDQVRASLKAPAFLAWVSPGVGGRAGRQWGDPAGKDNQLLLLIFLRITPKLH